MARLKQSESWSCRGQRSTAVLTLTLALFAVLIAATPAHGQFQVLYNFSGSNDGGNPHAGVTLDSGGNIYGTAYSGGLGYGTAFKLTHRGTGWVLSPLYSFKGKGANDGAGPDSSIVIGPEGIVYGTTISGGGNQDPYCQVGGGYYGCGTVYSLRPPPTRPATPFSPWTEDLLHLFTFDPDGAYPLNSTVFDAQGNLYGTGANGGTVYGVVWEISPSGNEQAIHTFVGRGDGGAPESGVVFDNQGNLYGTTSEWGYGEDGCCGTVFQLVPSGSGWSENTLYQFTDGNDGSTPYGGVIRGCRGKSLWNNDHRRRQWRRHRLRNFALGRRLDIPDHLQLFRERWAV